MIFVYLSHYNTNCHIIFYSRTMTYYIISLINITSIHYLLAMILQFVMKLNFSESNAAHKTIDTAEQFLLLILFKKNSLINQCISSS